MIGPAEPCFDVALRNIVQDRTEVRLAGAGKHGVIEAGLILQEAAAFYDDLNAHHVQSYGQEARSDWARSEVIISHDAIDYPKATQLDVLLVTTQEAMDRYLSDLKAEGLLLFDEEVEPPAELPQRSLRLPILKAAEDLRNPKLVHIVALGALVEATKLVTKPAVEAAVRDHVPRGGEALQLKALLAGYRLGRQTAERP